MKKLNKKELEKTKGGISGWGIVGIIAGIVFSVGVLDGITRPLKCNQEVFVMNRINNTHELMLVVGGGFNITGTLANAVLSISKFIYQVGQGLGSSIRRIGNNKLCKIS